MHKPESVLENEMHKILLDLDIQTDHLIPTRRQDLVIVKKKKKKKKKKRTCQILKFAVPVGDRVKIKENEKRNNYLKPCQRTKKAMEHDGDIYCNWCAQNNPQMFDKGTDRFRNQRTSGSHPDYTIFKIGQNTEKSLGVLLSFRLQ